MTDLEPRQTYADGPNSSGPATDPIKAFTVLNPSVTNLTQLDLCQVLECRTPLYMLREPKGRRPFTPPFQLRVPYTMQGLQS